MEENKVFSVDLAKRILKRTNFKIKKLEEVIANSEKTMSDIEKNDDFYRDASFAGAAIGNIEARKELVKLFAIKDSVLNIIIKSTVSIENEKITKSVAENIVESFMLSLDAQYIVENTKEVYKN